MGSADLMLFAGLFLTGYAVYLFVHTLLAEKNNQPALEWANTEAPSKSKSAFLEFSRPLIHRFTLPVARKISLSKYRESTLRKISSAGLEKHLNADEFIGLQLLWGFLFPILIFLLDFSLELGNGPVLTVFISGFGIYFPFYFLSIERKRRHQFVLADLPYFIDIFALSTEAGLDFIGSIQKVVEKAEESLLAQELGLVLQGLKLGQSRAEALKALAHRLDMSEVTSFIAVLVDADATGASIADVLKQQSVQMRVERFTRAEKAGARASQAILIPLMLFILPAVFIMVFGPVVLQFMGAR